jgi:hypothetical protein
VSTKPASREFLREVNEVCIAVRQGAPAPLHTPYTTKALTLYARAARPAASRTAVSLDRLATEADGHALQGVAADYRQAEATYVAAITLARGTKAATALGDQISIREQLASAAARSEGIPACGVAGR